MSNFGSTSTEPDESEPGFIKEKPLSFRESRFVGLSIAIRKSFNSSFLHWRNYRTAVHEGDDVLDKFPLLLVFPDLRKNPVDLQAIVDGLLLPEEITRKLVGKKADFTHLKKSRQRKGYTCEDHLPTILEEQMFIISDHKHRGNLKI